MLEIGRPCVEIALLVADGAIAFRISTDSASRVGIGIL